MDPDQLASKPADLDLHCHKRIDIWILYCFRKSKLFQTSTERYKLICSFGAVKFSFIKYIMAGHVEDFTILNHTSDAKSN